MESERAPPHRRAAAAVTFALVGLVFLGIAVAWALGQRRLEVGTGARTLLADGRRVVVRHFHGPAGTPERELQLRDAALAVVWTTPIEPGYVGSLHVVEDGVLYVDGLDGETMYLRDVETGTVRWAQPLDHPWEYRPSILALRVLGDDVVEVLEEPYGLDVLVRRRSLATGALVWSGDAVAVRGDGDTEIAWEERAVFVGSPRRIVRVDLTTGATLPLAPEDASATCRTSAESLYVDGATRLWLRPFEGEPRALGDLGGYGYGRLSCARAEGRVWVEWWNGGEARDDDFDPTSHLEPMAWPHTPVDAVGAAFVLGEGGEYVWGVWSAWGGPGFGIGTGSRFVVPRARPGQLVLHVEEGFSGGEEIGIWGGRTADVVVDEATGRVL